MGRGGSSCLKIIACAGDPADTDDVEAVQEKALSSNKRKWSFRKRSTSHRVLGNNVATEPTSIVENDNKIPEVDSNYHRQPSDAPVPSKTPVVKFVEEPTPIPITLDLSESEASDSLPVTVDTRDPDSLSKKSVILIQSAIRGYLARKALIKLRKIVKLQASIRGHLVRRQAIGTLRCVQSIVKMQALVRARHWRRNAGKLVKNEGKEINDNKQNKMCTSERLLTNRFACQLLESASSKKSKVIHINCDSSRSDSAWKWLERWMAITPPDVPPQQENDPNTCIKEQDIEHGRPYTADVLTEEQIAPLSLPTVEQKSEVVNLEAVELQPANISLPLDSIVDSNSEVPTEALIEDKAPSSLLKDCSSYNEDDVEMFIDDGITKEACDSNLSQFLVESDAKVQSDAQSERHNFNIDKSRCTTERLGEPRDNEGKKFGSGLRKTCSPAFAAVQSKFEEMSSMPNSSRSLSTYQEVAEDQDLETFTLQTDGCSKAEDDSKEIQNSDGPVSQDVLLLRHELNVKESSPSHEIRIQAAASECGTEISISSTLDSPDSSKAEGGEIVLEIGALERNFGADIGAHNACDSDYSDSDNKNILTNNWTDKGSKPEENDSGDPANHISDISDTVHDKQLSEEPAASDMSVKLDDTTDQQEIKTPPDGSPRSHITAPDSHGTPASQVSINNKKSKRSNLLTGKPRFQVIGKKSPANENSETSAKCKPENLSKDTKNAKRRNSLGTAKPDHGDHEPRLSNSNILPNYMQATESARAKINLSNSPKASPDARDKDSYPRKRHSLPLSKQASSPRMKQPTSQVQQSSKGNGVHSPHSSSERKWQR